MAKAEEDKSVQFGLSLPRHLLELVDEDAAEQLRSRSNQIAFIIREYYRHKSEARKTVIDHG